MSDDDLSRLRAIGLSETAAREKAALFDLARSALATVSSGGAAASRHWIPGRVEFLGKHTDYAGGRSLLCAVERGICILATPRSDRRVRIIDAAHPDDVVDTPIDANAEAPAGHWSTYPLTVIRRMSRDFGDALVGADVSFVSDLPVAAGMSSSSALVVATFLALADVNRLSSTTAYIDAIHSDDDLAAYLGAVESGRRFSGFTSDAGVGVLGGSEDQTAILCGRPRMLVQYSFCPVRFERSLPLPGDHELVIASSGVAAEKIGAARDRYNRLSHLTRAIADRWREMTGRSENLAEAIGSSGADAVMQAIDGAPPQDVVAMKRRLEHFAVESNELIPKAGDALARGDLAELGTLVDRSQAGAEELLGNQIRETIWLARDARLLGAAAASAFGAGFGGSVWALVRSEIAETFREQWLARYVKHFPEPSAAAAFFVTRAGPAARRL